MPTYVLDPGRIANFDTSDGAAFVLMTDDVVASSIKLVDPSNKYSDLSILTIHSDNELNSAFSALPTRSHILVVLPNIYFPSPTAEVLGPMRKLAVLACHSTPTSLEMVHHFLTQACITDPKNQERLAERFFTFASDSSHIIFEDRRLGTKAIFKIHDNELQWHEQIGLLSWGEQQLLPSGEVSTLAVDVFGQDIESTLLIDGTLALSGFSVLHSGVQSVRLEDQARLFEELSTIDTDAVIATVKHGRVVKFEATGSRAVPALAALNALSTVDSRYSTVVEIGFGINTELRLFPGNSASNRSRPLGFG